MKKFNVSLDPSKVERLKAVARHRAVRAGRDANWVMLVREAVDHILASEERGQHGTDVVSFGGAR